jgi:hypothetical protein
MPPGLPQALGPVLEQIAEMTLKIKQYDREIQQPKPKGKVTGLKGLPCLFLHGVLAHRNPLLGKMSFTSRSALSGSSGNLRRRGSFPKSVLIPDNSQALATTVLNSNLQKYDL